MGDGTEGRRRRRPVGRSLPPLPSIPKPPVEDINVSDDEDKQAAASAAHDPNRVSMPMTPVRLFAKSDTQDAVYIQSHRQPSEFRRVTQVSLAKQEEEKKKMMMVERGADGKPLSHRRAVSIEDTMDRIDAVLQSLQLLLRVLMGGMAILSLMVRYGTYDITSFLAFYVPIAVTLQRIYVTTGTILLAGAAEQVYRSLKRTHQFLPFFSLLAYTICFIMTILCAEVTETMDYAQTKSSKWYLDSTATAPVSNVTALITEYAAYDTTRASFFLFMAVLTCMHEVRTIILTSSSSNPHVWSTETTVSSFGGAPDNV